MTMGLMGFHSPAKSVKMPPSDLQVVQESMPAVRHFPVGPVLAKLRLQLLRSVFHPLISPYPGAYCLVSFVEKSHGESTVHNPRRNP